MLRKSIERIKVWSVIGASGELIGHYLTESEAKEALQEFVWNRGDSGFISENEVESDNRNICHMHV